QPSFVFAKTSSTGSERSRFISHPFLPYAARPFDARQLFFHREAEPNVVEYDVTNNSLGFRSPERTFAKPPGVRRVITLGGSTTWDGPTNDQTWPAILERELNQEYAGTGHRVEVINMGIDMASSPMSLI